MKYIFFIIIAFLIVQEVPAQVRLSTMDSVTSFQPTDLFWLNTKPSSSFVNRKVSWYYLRSNMIDYIDGLANTWAARQTFNGATFGAASYGAIVFEDSVWNAGTSYLNRIYPTTSSTSQIGTLAIPYERIWTRSLTIPNTYGNDSVSISYEDSTLSFDKALRFPSLTITETVGIDSGATLSAIIYDNVEYTVSSAADSIITLTTYSPSVQLILPADVTSPGISRIHMNEATKGQIVRFWVSGGSYDITFTDTIGDDDNLEMAGDITLSYLDNITFQYVGLSGGKQIWMETGRSNN